MTITTLTILGEIFNHEIPQCVTKATLPSQIVFQFVPQNLNISIKFFRVGAHTMAQIYIERPSGLEMNIYMNQVGLIRPNCYSLVTASLGRTLISECRY